MTFTDKQNSLARGDGHLPLATKLQQVLLQSQLPKPQNSGSSPLSSSNETQKSSRSYKSLISNFPIRSSVPMLYSYSTKDSNLGTNESRSMGDFSYGGEPKPLITCLDEMLMEDDISDDLNMCLHQEDVAYQTIEKGFADLIDKDSLSQAHGNKTFDFDERKRFEEYNNVWKIESLNFTQLSEKIMEDHLMNELCQHEAQSPCVSVSSQSNSGDVVTNNVHCMDPMHNISNPFSSNELKGHINTTMGIYRPFNVNGGIEDNAIKFVFTNGDENQLANKLIKCAEAIGQNDVKNANGIIAELHDLSSSNGNGVQRMAHYVTTALVAKMFGTATQLYTATCNNTPATGRIITRAYRSLWEYTPYCKLHHMFSDANIMDVCKNASQVHLVDYGIMYGSLHWPCFIQQLAMREQGPPHVRITGIDQPYPRTSKPSKRVQEIGQMLSEFAKLWKVPFEFTAIAEKWENITPTKLSLRKNEVLIVTCFFKLRNLMDASVTATNPRTMVLNNIRTMNPKVFVTGVVNANCNEPFFMSRVHETIKHYSTKFDTMDVVIPSNMIKRRELEEIYGREILNIIGCEGMERIERPESYKQWHSCIQRAGFVQKPLCPFIDSTIKSILGTCHKHFGIGQDGGWFLMGWKNEIVYALSAWKPTISLTKL
ncbi:unnamed protein product [Sphagnum jensenii]|uniref:GRAS family transcription factor n=1 Tax=Sphagnum jensenii TaxID=128206 RepID=A0ABP0X8T4_9BRYO